MQDNATVLSGCGIMRVKELIQILEEWDKTMDIAICDEDGEDIRQITSVDSYGLPVSGKLIVVIS